MPSLYLPATTFHSHYLPFVLEYGLSDWGGGRAGVGGGGDVARGVRLVNSRRGCHSATSPSARIVDIAYLTFGMVARRLYRLFRTAASQFRSIQAPPPTAANTS